MTYKNCECGVGGVEIPTLCERGLHCPKCGEGIDHEECWINPVIIPDEVEYFRQLQGEPKIVTVEYPGGNISLGDDVEGKKVLYLRVSPEFPREHLDSRLQYPLNTFRWTFRADDIHVVEYKTSHRRDAIWQTFAEISEGEIFTEIIG